MNNKRVKEIRKKQKQYKLRHMETGAQEFIEHIKSEPFLYRLKFAWMILKRSEFVIRRF